MWSTICARPFLLLSFDPEQADVAGFRRLFRRVGEPWLWASKLRRNDAELDAILAVAASVYPIFYLDYFLTRMYYVDDPTTVVGALPEPLLTPGHHAGGYVPNVVYTCGVLKVGERLLLPYGISDSAVGFATVTIADLVDLMH